MNRLGKALPPLASLLPFEAAARHQSFTRAAEELHLTQTAISRQIRSLEENLGVKLFERRNRAVFLTEAGRELSHAVTAGLEGIAARAQELRAPRRDREVLFSVELYLAVYWLMPRLSAFHQRHPRIELKVAAGTRPLAESTEQFDLAIQCSDRASGAHPCVFSAEERIYPVCSPAYLGDRTLPLPLEALQDERLLHFQGEPGDWIDWREWMRRQERPLRLAGKGTAFDSYPVMIQAAVAGHGIALGWQRGLASLVRSGDLVRPFRESLVLPQGISLYRRLGAPPRPEVAALQAWVEGEIRLQDDIDI